MRFGLYPLPVISTASYESAAQCFMQAGGHGGSAWPSANLAIYVPFTLYQPFTVDRMVLSVNTSSGNFDMGVYSVDGTRLLSTGSTAMSGTNVNQTVNVTDKVLAPGTYYMALALDNGTGAVYNCAAQIGTVRATGVLQQASAFPLPANATFAIATNAYVPTFGICNRSFV